MGQFFKNSKKFSKKSYPKMFLTRSEYDRSVNTFSPEGRLFQVEYAIEAIKLGSTAIGIQTGEGVVLAVEKRITSSLMEPTSIEKIVEVDKHVAVAFSGLTADSKMLIERARVESQNHWFTHDRQMPIESIAQSVSNLAIQFGESDSEAMSLSRPFGVALLLLVMILITEHNCFIWILRVLMSNSMPKQSVLVAKEHSKVCKKYSIKK